MNINIWTYVHVQSQSEYGIIQILSELIYTVRQ